MRPLLEFLLLDGGVLFFVLAAWLMFSRQRDVLETAETRSRMLVGTLLVALQLGYYTALALLVFRASVEVNAMGR